VRLHVKADHFSSSEALSELKDINDLEIKEVTHDIILELIQKKQFQLAVDLACAQILTLSVELGVGGYGDPKMEASIKAQNFFCFFFLFFFLY